MVRVGRQELEDPNAIAKARAAASLRPTERMPVLQPM